MISSNKLLEYKVSIGVISSKVSSVGFHALKLLIIFFVWADRFLLRSLCDHIELNLGLAHFLILYWGWIQKYALFPWLQQLLLQICSIFGKFPMRIIAVDPVYKSYIIICARTIFIINLM